MASDAAPSSSSTGTLTLKMSEGGPAVIRDVCESRGWRNWDPEAHGDTQWNLHWRSGRFKPSEYKNANLCQRLNHFPKSEGITRKDHLLRALRKFQGIHGRVYDIHPPAFILPTEYTKFVQAYSRQDKKGIWICKPTDLSRGRKIFLIRDLSELTYDTQMVIQKYVDRPLCPGGYKLDLRVYVLVTSFAPLRAYIYRDGLARFATEKYDSDMEDLGNLFSHLTNASINKFSATYADDKDVIGPGSKWTFGQLRGWFEKHDLEYDTLWGRIENLCLLTLLTCAAGRVPVIESCFELYGFDVLVDTDMKPCP